MLVLTRRLEESLIIEGESGESHIVITILAIEGDKVKIGVNAPRQIKVLREELWQAIHEQDKLAEHLASGAEPETFQELRKMLADEADDEAQSKIEGE